MNILSPRNAASRIGMGTGIVAVLFAASIGLHGQQPASTPAKPLPKPPPQAAKPAAPPAKAAPKPPAALPQKPPAKAPASPGGSVGTGKPGTGTSNGPKSPGTTGPGTKSGGTAGGTKSGGTAGGGKTGGAGTKTPGAGAGGSTAKGTSVSHGPGGSTRIAAMRPDRSGIVTNRAGHGYVQKPFLYHNQQFVARTYFYGGRPYALYYQGYPYRGFYLFGYAPYSYYAPAFYGWAYNPWGPAFPYAWGWYGNPWYAYYGYYFSPYARYQGASYWLTDYLISSSLQQAYQEQLDAGIQPIGPPAGGAVVLTPEVKQAIATEVRNQIALENSESQTVAQGGDIDINSSGLPRILAETSPGHPHVFVVSSPITVTDSNGQQCGLTEGDILRLSTPPSDTDTSVYLEVFASKNQECGSGTMVLVGLADLQEMQNYMRATIDQGLQALQNRPGGFPAPPAAAAVAPIQSGFAPIAPPPDPNASVELRQEAQQGN
jgi:hypothetical protein